MSDERLTDLETRYAWLEQHVAAQDKAMAEMGDELRRLRREVETLRARQRAADGVSAPEPEAPPPHY